jgi:hypothetical protein
MNLGYKLSKGIINWGYNIEIEQFIMDNLEDYQNLDNHYHWSNKMTPEDRKLKRHPNRSSRWIPKYIEDQRKDLRVRLMEALLGPNNFNPSDWSPRYEPCYRCRVSSEDRYDFTKAMTDCMESYPDGPYFPESSVEEHEKIRDKCWQETSEKFDPLVARSIDKLSWTQGSIPAWSSMTHGFCTTCYRQIKQEMKKVINDISGNE